MTIMSERDNIDKQIKVIKMSLLTGSSLKCSNKTDIFPLKSYLSGKKIGKIYTYLYLVNIYAFIFHS